jgi:cytochrome c1
MALIAAGCAPPVIAPTAPPATSPPAPAAAKPTAQAAPSPAASPAVQASPAALASPAAQASPAGQAAPAAKPQPAAASPADIAAGQQLITQKGCGGCHTVPGVAGANGTVGPNLGGVGSRPTIAGGVVPHNGPDDLKRWILDPPALKPGTAMPKLGLSDEEATRIAAFLETLK